MPLVFSSPATSTVIDAVRIWRIARDLGQPAQPTLSAHLGASGGFLAPVVDGLLTLFEAGFHRRFDAGAPADVDLTSDERRLLDLLDRDASAEPVEQLGPDLAPAWRTALRSTRIVLRWIFGLAPAG